MYPLWIDRNLLKKLKLHLYEASVLSILTHGCETWSLTGKGGKGGLQATLKLTIAAFAKLREGCAC